MTVRRPSLLQVTYQRNFLAAILVTLFFIALPLAVVVTMIGGNDDIVRADDFSQTVEKPTPAPTEPPRHYSGGVLPAKAPQAGFIGYVGDKVQIVGDFSALDVPVAALVTSTDMKRLTPDAGASSISALKEEGAAGSVPDIGILDGLPGLIGDGSNTGPVNRAADIIVTNEPEYPRVAKMMQMEGRVSFVIKISSTGKLAPFSARVHTTDGGPIEVEVFEAGSDNEYLVLFVREEPEGMFFRNKIEKVIYDWAFLPAVEDNTPVPMYYEVTYRFCLTETCHHLFVNPMSR
jgi:hypothetical protein